ncbi:MAG TPA: hypothetical protein VHS03_02675, partial [Gaiellaceae bacterium]|nr:hypothetical protein [Gaiellaceae bacterium]
MKRNLSRSLLVLVAGAAGLVLVAGAAGTPASGTKAIQTRGPVAALALDGSRAAFGNGPSVIVWDVANGRQTKVGGVGDKLLSELAIAGTRVAWRANATSNSESDDYLYTSSLLQPKQRQVAKALRFGSQCGAGESGRLPACTGPWLGGLVGAGKRILVDRWTTNRAGAITGGGLYALQGKRLARVAAGSRTVEAVTADPARVAVVQWRWLRPEKTIHVYSSTGRALWSVVPKSWPPLGIGVSGRNLVVLEPNGALALYDARTGSLRKTFHLHAAIPPKHQRSYSNPQGLQALSVQGNIAVYSKPVRLKRGIPSESAIHAVNLSTGKDRAVGTSRGQIPL